MILLLNNASFEKCQRNLLYPLGNLHSFSKTITFTGEILGNIYTWANINVYYVSYVRLSNPSFTLGDGFFMVPILLFVNHCVLMIGGYAEKYTGPRLFNIVGFLLILGTHVLLYFFTDYWIIMFSMCLFGIAFGTDLFPMLKTSWMYFPQKKGLISGMVLGCIGFSTFIFTSLADYIINPEGKQAIDGYFEKEIAIRTKDFILIMIYIITGLGLLSNCLVFPYKEEETRLTVGLNETSVYVQKERIKEIVRSRQFYLLGLLGLGNAFVGFVITNTNRTFGTMNKLDETLLQTLSKVYALLNGSTRIIWGIVYDKVSFRILFCAIMVNYNVCLFSYYFCGQNGITFFIVNCLAVLSFSGNATIINPVLIHYFGIKNSVIITGMYNYVYGVVGLISPIICKFVIKSVSDFLILYMTGGCFSLLSFTAFCLMKPEPYVYTWKNKAEQEQEDLLKKTEQEQRDIKEKQIEEEASGRASLDPFVNNTSILDRPSLIDKL